MRSVALGRSRGGGAYYNVAAHGDKMNYTVEPAFLNASLVPRSE